MSYFRSGFWVLLAFISGGGKAFAGGGQLFVRGSVVAPVCEIRATKVQSPVSALTGGSRVIERALMVPWHEAYMLYFPDAQCRASAFGHGKNLNLVVAGPDAKGAEGGAWGERYHDRAYGIRLRYQEGARSRPVYLTPVHNTLTLSHSARLRGRGQDATDFSVIIRPEWVFWDRDRQEKRGALDVPLVFLVSWP